MTSIPAFENWLEMDLHCDVHHVFNTSWTKDTSSFLQLIIINVEFQYSKYSFALIIQMPLNWKSFWG